MPHVYTNGIVTFYEDSGEGPAVVLIHGHAADLRTWRFQAQPLVDAGFRIIRYDIRGHGRSHVPPGGYTWQNYSADLRDLLDRVNVERPATEELSLQRVHLVGLSMGGGVALQFAVDNPDRVLSLTLVDTALPGFSYSEEMSSRIELLVQAVRSKDRALAFEQMWLTHPFFDGVRRYPERFALIRDMAMGYPAADYVQDIGPEDVPADLIGRLGEVQAPALVIVGQHDVEDFRQIAELLSENLPRARLLVMPDTWHLPPLEQPDAFNRELIDFLRSIPG